MNVAERPPAQGNALPPLIDAYLQAPYRWARHVLPAPILEVGGGSRRLGHTLLGATDLDHDPACGNDVTGDMLALPFAEASFASVLCLETIEHCATPLLALAELLRVARHVVLVGSVNHDGPNFLGTDALWKGSSNPYHLSEMGTRAFRRLFGGLSVAFYGSLLTVEATIAICPGLHAGALSHYAFVTKAPPERRSYVP